MTERGLPPTHIPELDTFLVPIGDENPSGDSLRYDSVYSRIRKMREQDDPSLPQGVWQRELKRADWRGVAELCTSALSTRTKDLQLAAWLTEAWLNLQGFAGLAQGLRLTASLCRHFWDSLHPPIEDGKLDLRLSPIVWIGEKLLFPAKSVLVTEPKTQDAVPMPWRDWEGAVHQKMIADRARIAGQPVTDDGTAAQATFLRSVHATPGAWFAQLTTEIEGALDAIAELEEVLIEKAGEDATPSFGPLREVLEDIHGFVQRQRDERIAAGEITKSEGTPMLHVSDDAHRDDAEAPVAEVRAAGVIASRADAYQKLREASDYLMRTEPHSPVPYLIRRAISWGNLSLAELLEELLQKNADLATVYALLGIKRT